MHITLTISLAWFNVFLAREHASFIPLIWEIVLISGSAGPELGEVSGPYGGLKMWDDISLGDWSTLPGLSITSYSPKLLIFLLQR